MHHTGRMSNVHLLFTLNQHHDKMSEYTNFCFDTCNSSKFFHIINTCHFTHHLPCVNSRRGTDITRKLFVCLFKYFCHLHEIWFMHSFSTNVLICTLSTVNKMATNISAFKEYWERAWADYYCDSSYIASSVSDISTLLGSTSTNNMQAL